MEQKFYVYEHRRASDGRVFYVGKGCGNRSKTTSKRNKHWQNVVNKHGFTHHIIKSGISECEAFDLEQKIIDRYGVENLSNMTGGGDGMKRPTQEVRARFSKLQVDRWKCKEYRANLIKKFKGRIVSEETREKKRISMTGKQRSPEHCAALSAALKGKPKPEGYAEKMSAIKRGKMIGEQNPSFDPSLHAFSNNDTLFIGTCWHMAKINGLKRHNVDNMKSGKSRNHQGWSYLGSL